MSIFPSWSDLFDPGAAACLKRANETPQVAAIDDERNRLAKTWHPTDYFDPQQVWDTTKMLVDEFMAALDVLNSAPDSTEDSETVKNMAAKSGIKTVQDRGLAYFAAAAEASRENGVVHAPGFKKFCLDCMGAISEVYVTALVLQCRQTWLQALLDRAWQVISAIGRALAMIGGVIVKIGEKIINAVEAGFDFIAAVIKYAPYVGLGLAGLFVYTWVRKAQDLGPDETIHAITSATTRAGRAAGRAGWRAGGRVKRRLTSGS